MIQIGAKGYLTNTLFAKIFMGHIVRRLKKDFSTAKPLVDALGGTHSIIKTTERLKGETFSKSERTTLFASRLSYG